MSDLLTEEQNQHYSFTSLRLKLCRAEKQLCSTPTKHEGGFSTADVIWPILRSWLWTAHGF
jgi:hypothetical protein